MPDLRFEHVQAVGGEATMRDWQRIHNRIIPTDPLSFADIQARAQASLRSSGMPGQDRPSRS